MNGFDYGDVFNGINEIKQKQICDSLDNATVSCKKCFVKYICARSCVRDIAKSNGKFIKFPEEYYNMLRETVANYLVLYYQSKKQRPDLLNQEKFEKAKKTSK